MDLKLTGQKALVTGSTAGIGLEIARRLALEGAEVVVVGRDAAKVERALGDLRRSGGVVEGLVADVTTAEGANAVLAAVPDVEILVNNLGIYETRPFAEIDDDEWRRFFEINVLSGIRLTRHYFDRMLAKKTGRVIFVSSETGLVVDPMMIHYATTKTAQLAIARASPSSPVAPR